MDMKNSKNKFLKLLNKHWPLLAILLIVCGFFWRVFFKKEIPLPGDFVVGVYYPWLDYKWGYEVGVPVKNPMTTDVVSLIYPEQMLAVDLLKKGEWPLWNPHILAGTPLFANLQAAPFSPTIFLYFLFDKLTAWSAQIIFQHVLAAIFTYILLRYWKVSKLGSVFGSIAFSFSGFNLIFSQWNGHTLSSAFLPLAILFTDKILKKGKWLDCLALSFCLTFQLLSGYPQTSLYTAIAIAVLWIVRARKIRKQIFIKSLPLLISGFLALLLSAFQILPTAELWKLSQRNFEPHPFEWAFLPFKKIITFIAPDYFGNHATQNYWGPQDYTSNTAYMGVVVFVLATMALKKIKENKEIFFLAFLSIFSLILSFPNPFSVFLWKNNIIGMRAASAHRATILFTFGASMLSGFGMDYLMDKRKKVKYFFSLLFPYLLVGGFGIVTLYLYFKTKGNYELSVVRNIPKYYVGLRNLVLPVLILGLTTLILFLNSKLKKKNVMGFSLLFLMVFELFRFGFKYTPFSSKDLVFPDTPVLTFLKDQDKPFRVTGNSVIPVNMRTPYELDSPEGYETIHPLRISQFLAALNSGKSGTDPVGRYGTVDNDVSHLLDLVNTKFYLTHKINEKGDPDPKGEIPQRFLANRFSLTFEDKSVAIIESRLALPRAFMVYDWETINDDNEILNALLNKNFEFNKKIILEEDYKDPGNSDSYSEVEYLSFEKQKSEIRVKSEEDGLLFVSDALYPGWEAFVNGKKQEILRADFAFMAIPISKGESTIVIKYNSPTFNKGLKISAITLIVIVISTSAVLFCKKCNLFKSK